MAEDLDITFISDAESGAHQLMLVYRPIGLRQYGFKAPFAPSDLIRIRQLQREASIEHKAYVQTLQDRGSSRSAEEQLQEYGAELFNALFAEEGRKILDECREQQQVVRVRLRLAPELVNIPWELLYDPEKHKWLFLDAKMLLVRSTQRKLSRALDLRGDSLKVLAIAANPKNTPKLETEREISQLKQSLSPLEELGIATLDIIEGRDTIAQFERRAQLGRSYHVLHFIGHGDYDEQSKVGSLVVEDPDGKRLLWGARQLVNQLGSQVNLRLFVLNACRTAQADAGHELSSVANAIIEHANVPAVVAMQFPISDEAANAFSPYLYQALTFGRSLDEAIAQARAHIDTVLNGVVGRPGDRDIGRLSSPKPAVQYDRPTYSVEWCTPVLFMNSLDGVVFSGLKGMELAPEQLFEKANELAVRQDFGKASYLFGIVESMDQADYARRASQKRQEAEKQEKTLRLQWSAQALVAAGHWRKLLLVTDEMVDLGADPPELPDWRRQATLEIEAQELMDDVQQALDQGRVDKAELSCQELLGMDTSLRQQATDLWRRLPAHRELNQLAQRIQKELRVLKVNWQSIDELSTAALGKLKNNRELESDAPGQKYEEQFEGHKEEARRQLGWQVHCARILDHLSHLKVASAVELFQRFEKSPTPPSANLVDELKRAIETARARLKSAETWLDLLAKSPCLWDPELPRLEEYPYHVLADLGVHPGTPIAQINDMKGIAGKATEHGLGEFNRKLARPQERLWVDLFTYEVADCEALRRLCPSPAHGDVDWPDEMLLKSNLGADAIIALVIVGEREQAARMGLDLLRERPDDGRLAHHLAVLHLADAESAETAPDRDSILAQRRWELAIACWAMALHNDTFWSHWQQRREQCYGGPPLDTSAVEAIKIRLVTYLNEQLLKPSAQSEADPATTDVYRKLQTSWDLEHRAATWLKKTGGIEGRDHAGKVVAGPVGIRILALEDRLAEHVRIASQDAGDERGKEATAWVRYCYSELGLAALDTLHEWPQQAIEELKTAACPNCPKCENPECPNHDANAEAPRVCCASCPDFDRLNPAYRQLPNKGRVLYEEAQELMRRNWLKAAEIAIAQPEPDIAKTEAAWRRALSIATELRCADETRSAIASLALGRAQGITGALRDNGQTRIERLTNIIDILDAALEFVPKQRRLELHLAEALTDRGVGIAVYRGTVESNSQAIPDLQRALALNPNDIRTRNELCVAMNNVTPGVSRRVAIALLRDSLGVAEGTLERHPGDARCVTIIAEIAQAEAQVSGQVDRAAWTSIINKIEQARRTAEDTLARNANHEPSNDILLNIAKIELYVLGKKADALFDELGPSSEFDELVASAHQKQREGDLEGAVDDWHHAVQLRPHDEPLKVDLEAAVIQYATKLSTDGRRQQAYQVVSRWSQILTGRRRLERLLEEIKIEIELFDFE